MARRPLGRNRITRERGATTGDETSGELEHARPVSEQREGEEDVLDRVVSSKRGPGAPQAAGPEGALEEDGLSRDMSINDPVPGRPGSGQPGDMPHGGRSAQLPSGQPSAVAIQRGPELGARGMPPAAGPVATGSSHPALVAQNAHASVDPTFQRHHVLGGAFRRVR